MNNWWNRRQQNRRQEQRGNGYQWAAGQLLSGVNVNEVEAYTLCIDCDEFDEGIKLALIDWEKLNVR